MRVRVPVRVRLRVGARVPAVLLPSSFYDISCRNQIMGECIQSTIVVCYFSVGHRLAQTAHADRSQSWVNAYKSLPLSLTLALGPAGADLSLIHI